MLWSRNTIKELLTNWQVLAEDIPVSNAALPSDIGVLARPTLSRVVHSQGFGSNDFVQSFPYTISACSP
jgi:hypothetical protein